MTSKGLGYQALAYSVLAATSGAGMFVTWLCFHGFVVSAVCGVLVGFTIYKYN